MRVASMIQPPTIVFVFSQYELVIYLVPIAFCLGMLVAKAWGK